MSNNLARKIKKGFLIIIGKIIYPSKYIKGKYFSAAEQSFLEHNDEYLEEESFAREKKVYEKYEKENNFNTPEGRYEDFIKAHPEVRGLAIDIGSGCGWLSAKLGLYFAKVVGLEPSAKAVEMARKLCPPEMQNIEYIAGFAQDELNKLEIKEKALFVTSTVLSHLPDKAVAEICRIVSAKAPLGSLLIFAETYGKEYHQPMWHCRTKEWWQKNLPGWEINFLDNPIEKKRYKGFQAVKIQ